MLSVVVFIAVSIIGIVVAWILGYKAYFVHHKKLHRRNNEHRRESVELAFVVAATAASLWANIVTMSTGLVAERYGSFLFDSFLFAVFYTALLFGTDWLAGVIHLGLITRRKLHRKSAAEVAAEERQIIAAYKEQKQNQQARRNFLTTITNSTHGPA